MEFILPSSGDRIRHPPSGFFTVYSVYFSSGFTLPPHPLLVDIIRHAGLCISQLTPNAFMFFLGFLHCFGELGLIPSLEAFHTLFVVKKVLQDSYFCFYPRSGCKFLEGCTSSWGPWKEIFFYIRDADWGLYVPWGESPSPFPPSHDLRMSFIRAGLFDHVFDLSCLFTDGIP